VASPWNVQEETKKISSHSEVYLVVFTVYNIATGFGFLQKPSGIYKIPAEIRKTKYEKLRCV
jgi:hypothetical protein